jgi:hypothetical protein
LEKAFANRPAVSSAEAWLRLDSRLTGNTYPSRNGQEGTEPNEGGDENAG